MQHPPPANRLACHNKRLCHEALHETSSTFSQFPFVGARVLVYAPVLEDHHKDNRFFGCTTIKGGTFKCMPADDLCLHTLGEYVDSQADAATECNTFTYCQAAAA